MMIYQNSTAEKLPYLYYLNDDVLHILSNPYFLLFLLNSIVVIYHIYKKDDLSHIQILSLIVPSIVCLLSFMGKYPWDALKNTSSTLLIVLNLMVELGKIKRIPALVSICMLCLLFRFVGSFPYIEKGRDLAKYTAVVEMKKYVNNKIFVDYCFNPSVRYLYEYGPFSENNNAYANQFYFQSGKRHGFRNGESHGQKPPIINPDEIKCDYYLVNDDNYTNLEKVENKEFIYRSLN